MEDKKIIKKLRRNKMLITKRILKNAEEGYRYLI